MRMPAAALALAAVPFLPFLAASAAEEAPVAPLSELPVREVTVFKDGHAFVVHHGKVPVDALGDVVLDDLPTPVLGTFWPFATGTQARLASVVTGKRRFREMRPASGVADMLEANPGAGVWLHEPGKPIVKATADAVVRRGNDVSVVVRSAEGVRPVPLAWIDGVQFAGEPKTEVPGEQERDAFTLHLEWAGGKPAGEAEVGMGYLQKGIRWIPSYRVEIDGEGRASVRLQATLLNELADLKDVTLHLAVGVPSFDFRATADPMGLQRALAPLSPYFQTDAAAFTNGALGSNFVASNQVMRAGETRRTAPVEVDLPESVTGEKAEDLHVFTVRGVTLRRGERMLLPISEMTIPYEDAYSLDLPFSPPAEVRTATRDPRALESLRLLLRPRPIHRLRLVNAGNAPLTTAPAVVLKAGRILGQGTMTYAAPGTTVDIDVTAAINVSAARKDREVARTPNSLRVHKEDYARVDMEGTITLTNAQDRPVTVEVSRWVPGGVDGADHQGSVSSVDARDDEGWLTARAAPWGSWDWPGWWTTLNGATEVTWKVVVEPGKSVTLGYRWHYFWR